MADMIEAFSSDRTLTGEVKEMLIETLFELVQGHRQTRRAQTDLR